MASTSVEGGYHQVFRFWISIPFLTKRELPIQFLSAGCTVVSHPLGSLEAKFVGLLSSGEEVIDAGDNGKTGGIGW